MSFCRNSGSNYPLCSQSQKMSIGIVVDSVAKHHHGSTKEAEVSMKKAEKGVYNQEHLMVGKNVKQDLMTSGPIKMSKEHDGEESRRTKTGSFTINVLKKDTDHIEKQPSRPAMFRDKQTRQSRQHIEAGGVVSGKEVKGDVMAERYEEFPCEDKQEACVAVKDVLQEQPTGMENRSKDTLRMKLQEILGTVPSANNRFANSRNVEVGEVTQEQTREGDAIETDSGNADMTVRRPVTRPLARKRVPARTSPRDLKRESLSCYKAECQGKSIFSFVEKSAPSQPREINFGFLTPEKNDNDKGSCGIKPREMLFHETDMVNIQRVISGGKRLPPVEEFSLGGRMISPEHARPNENIEAEKTMQNTHFDHSPTIREKDQQQDADCPVPPEESDHHKSFDHQSPVHHDDNSSSPLFKMTRTVPGSPMSSSPPINEKKHNVHGSVQASEGVDLKGTCVLNSSPAIEEDNSGSSDDEAMPEKAYDGTPELSTEVEEAENELFTHERREFNSIGEVSSAKKVYPEDLHTSSKNEFVGKPMPFRNKRHCSHGVDSSDLSSTLHSPRACGTTDDALMEDLEENPDDGLTRVVSLLGLALERVNNKMMSVTNKRCSDILMSAAEEIHSQLQDVKSQIQTDLGKLTSLNKAKRKHLETRFQEQDRNLNAIHEKFKEEIRNYLQDCRGQMELLEAQYVELKAANERQKASHRKLLLQANTAVETHLNGAQRRVTSVRKLGRQKMLKLKAAIAECLKDGISS